jgi:hypothetical protein
MLPPVLEALRNRLKAKPSAQRTSYEDKVLEELEAVDRELGDDVVEFSTGKIARSNPGVSGPNPGTRCVFCGR